MVVINDRYSDWTGDVHLRWMKGTEAVAAQGQGCTVRSLGRQTITFRPSVPSAPGAYTLIAELADGTAEPVRSLRDAKVVPAR